jgi:hypothetical protein
MIDINPLIQAIAQGGWDAFQAAGQAMMNNVITFVCEMVMVAMVFMILFGLLFHFTHYSSKGAGMIVNGIVVMIVISCVYMAILGASGPPDISIWFRPPA